MTTINRKEYYPSASSFTPEEGWQSGDTGTVLSLPCINQSRDFDGSLDYTGLTIDDAFNIDDLTVQSGSASLLALAADIASVRLQPRLIPHAFSAPKVNGLVCTKNATLQDGVWLDCGTTLTSATPQTVSALNASDDAVMALMQEVSQVLGIPCASLWQIGDTSSVVSCMGGYTDGEALMDGRSTMEGYPVSDGADMVWTALGSAQLMALNASSTEKNGKSLLCRLLTMLGMPETMAQQEQAALSGGRLAVPTVSADGVIELKNADDTNPLIVGTEAKSRLLYKNGTSNAPWISVDADGASMLMWPENKGDVFALIAGMAKKAMDGIVGLGLVGGGKNGCPPKWILIAMNTYGIPMANLLAASAIDADIKKSFDETGRCIVSSGSQYLVTDINAIDEFNSELEFYTLDTSGSQYLCGARISSNYSMCAAFSGSSSNVKFLCSNGGKDVQSNNVTRITNTHYRVRQTWVKNAASDYSATVKFEDITNSISEEITSNNVNSSYTTSAKIHIFAVNSSQKAPSYGLKIYRYMYEDATQKHVFIPIIKDGEATMIDLMTMTYPTKVGTFTIE